MKWTLQQKPISVVNPESVAISWHNFPAGPAENFGQMKALISRNFHWFLTLILKKCKKIISKTLFNKGYLENTGRRADKCLGIYLLINPCLVGCSDFYFFFTFWGITTHPWHPKGPRIRKLAKKIFNFIHGLRKFLAKTGKCVFWV